MLNAGMFNRPITITKVVLVPDAQGFKSPQEVAILEAYASVKTTKGFTLIANNSDFEKAYTNFTIRYSETVENAYYNDDDSNRDMYILFRGKKYKVEYLNNVDEKNRLLEMQAKEILK